MRGFWRLHRQVFVLSGGRAGIRLPQAGRWGMLRLTTVGRRSGQARAVMLTYQVDGPNLYVLALNGVAPHDPAWLLNLRAQPEASVETSDLNGRSRPVRAREATGEERERLWAASLEIDRHLDAYAAQRPVPTAVVVLEPRPALPG
ncbi:nitroreductase/quinone reductase family protein [Kineosporia babensis]